MDRVFFIWLINLNCRKPTLFGQYTFDAIIKPETQILIVQTIKVSIVPFLKNKAILDDGQNIIDGFKLTLIQFLNINQSYNPFQILAF